MKKEKSTNIGCIAFLSPVIFVIISSAWFLIFNAIIEIDEIWKLVVSLMPFAISPILCLIGIIYGIINIKSKLGRECILLSFLGLLQNLAFIYGIYYMMYGEVKEVISWR